MILTIKTADNHTALCLFASAAAKSPAANLEWESGRALSDQLLGRLIQFLHEHHCELADLTGIVIFSGPGSFTSLRIGHTIANALADSLGIPLVGVRGEGWLGEGKDSLATAQVGHPALPYYGSEAHITRPKS